MCSGFGPIGATLGESVSDAVIQTSAMHGVDGTGRYLEGALRLLQYVETRTPTGRRFGPDADARWSSFRGDLETVDRIELMIRDADAEWPSGFGARMVYALRGVAEDEPFGSQWHALDPVAAEDLWRRVKAQPAPTTIGSALQAIAAAWDLKLENTKVDRLAPTDHIVIVGASAIAAMIDAFANGSGLDWSEQVVVIASAPAARQLAAAGTPLLKAKRPTQLFTATDEIPKPKRGTRLVASSDADPADLAAAKALLEG